jgi:hypothetical protein
MGMIASILSGSLRSEFSFHRSSSSSETSGHSPDISRPASCTDYWASVHRSSCIAKRMIGRMIGRMIRRMTRRMTDLDAIAKIHSLTRQTEN